jgi:hypothetical protein
MVFIFFRIRLKFNGIRKRFCGYVVNFMSQFQHGATEPNFFAPQKVLQDHVEVFLHQKID